MEERVKRFASAQIKIAKKIHLELRFRKNSSRRQEILMNMVLEGLNSNNDFCEDSFQF